jgi:hypothetical protein
MAWRPPRHSAAAMDPQRGRRLGLVPVKLALATRHLPGNASAEIDGARCAAPGFYTSLTGRRLGRGRPHTWWCAISGHNSGLPDAHTGRIPSRGVPGMGDRTSWHAGPGFAAELATRLGGLGCAIF